MPNSVTLYAPLSTDIVVKGFTNAAYLQRITVKVEGGVLYVITGAGEGNNFIGSAHFTTPASGGDDNQITITVTLEYSADGGQTWKGPDVYMNQCQIQAYNLTVVVGEDMTDEDYNDAICMISWP